MTESLDAVKIISTDVLVVGGGTAGTLAAIAAAEEGARVVLIDKDSAPGGVATRGGIHLYWYGSPGGLQDRIDAACHQRTTVLGGTPRGFHPEAKRSVIDEMFLEHSVTAIFNAIVFDVVRTGGRVTGVRAVTNDGEVEVRGKVTIDATGDGDIAAAAGAGYTRGRAVDGLGQGFSVIPRRVEGESKLNFINFDAGWIDFTDPVDVSDGYLKARSRLWELMKEEPHLLSISPQIGLREGRQIEGEYTLTWDDVVYNRPFPDVITNCFSHYDNHAYDFAHESEAGQIWTVVLGLFFEGLWCRIPYRSLVPKGVNGLLVGCRALSVDRDAHMLVRMQREIQKIGEAAGVAAALCVHHQVEPRNLNVDRLQQRLIARGILKPEDLDLEPHPSLKFTTGTLARKKLDMDLVSQQIDTLLEYFGTPEEGIAIWWLMQQGESIVPVLTNLLENPEKQPAHRAAAFALGLMGRPEAVPQLIRTLVSRDPERLERGTWRYKSYPRWVAAVTLLRMLRAQEALPSVLSALEEDLPSNESSFLLQYLHDLAPLFNSKQKLSILKQVRLFAAKPGLGEDFQLSGGRQESLRWVLDMRLALLYSRYGDQTAASLLAPYASSELAYQRRAAEITLQLIQAEALNSSSNPPTGRL